MEDSRTEEERNQKREQGNMIRKMRGVAEIGIEIFLAHARRPIRKMEERAWVRQINYGTIQILFHRANSYLSRCLAGQILRKQSESEWTSIWIHYIIHWKEA